MSRGRHWIRGGVAGLALIGPTLGWVWWAERDHNPPARLVIRLDEPAVAQGLTADGRAVVVAGDPLRAFDLANGQRVQPDPALLLYGKVASRDGRRVVGVATKALAIDHPASPQQVLLVVDAATEAIQFQVDLTGRWVGRLAWSDDEQAVRAAVRRSDGSVVLTTWALDSKAATTQTVAPPTTSSRWGVAFAPGCRLGAFLDESAGRVQFQDPATNQPRGSPVASPLPAPPGRASYSAAESDPTGRTLLIGRHDGRVEVWDVATRACIRVLELHPSDHSVAPLILSSDGRFLAANSLSLPPTSGWGGFLALVRARLTGASGVGDRRGVTLVDLSTGRTITRLDGEAGVTFTRDGRSLVTNVAPAAVAVRDLADLIGGGQ